MTKRTQKEIAERILLLQALIGQAYSEDESARLIIKSDYIEVIGNDGDVLEINCTPARAVARIVEDQP